jgi:hypothetical protein
MRMGWGGVGAGDRQDAPDQAGRDARPPHRPPPPPGVLRGVAVTTSEQRIVFHHKVCDPNHVPPPLPSVVERLRRAILPRRIAPPQAIAIDEDYAAQNPPIIDARLAMALRKERPQPIHLLVRQPN